MTTPLTLRALPTRLTCALRGRHLALAAAGPKQSQRQRLNCFSIWQRLAMRPDLTDRGKRGHSFASVGGKTRNSRQSSRRSLPGS